MSYSLLGSRREARKPVTILFAHRNAATWKDERLVAAFVSPNDPAVLEHSKYVAGLVRDRLRGGIDANLQYGLGFFEGLRLSGISFTADPTTPYRELHGHPDEVDYLQYPHQTLVYRSGDCDDLAILYAAALESVDVRTAFIPFEDDFLVAFQLSMSETDARTAFADPSAAILHGGRAWVPVQVSRIREGFLAAWQGGAKKCSDAAASGAPLRMFTLEDAWKAYKPVGIPGSGVQGRQAVRGAGLPGIRERDLPVRLPGDRAPGPEAARAHARRRGHQPGAQHPRDAVRTLRHAEGGEGPVCEGRHGGLRARPLQPRQHRISREELRGGHRALREAIGLQPDTKAALLGLARSRYELDQFAESDALFSALRAIDPVLADRFAYLSSRIEGAASRASAVADRRDVLWSDDGE